MKRGPGRPRTVDPSGNTSGARKISLWVTEKQYIELRAEAKIAGVSVGELLRRSVFRN
jgi:hypothetical protein